MQKFNTLEETPLFNFIMNNFPFDPNPIIAGDMREKITNLLREKFNDEENSWLYDTEPTEYKDNDFSWPNGENCYDITGAFVFGFENVGFWFGVRSMIIKNIENKECDN